MSRSLVHDATTDDANPPSGYILKELAQKTNVSSQDCKDVLSYLLKRLEKDSPDVRYKALQAIKYLCQNGRDEFRIALQRNNDLVRACSHYKGPPDPLRGDAPSARVRETAKETMTVIFDNSRAVHNSSVSGRIKGMSNTPQSFNNSPSYNNPSPLDRERDRFSAPPRETESPRGDYNGTYSVPKVESGAYSTGRMQGFGNPAFDNGPAKPTLVDRLRNATIGTGSGARSPDYQEYRRPGPYDPSVVSTYGTENIPAPATADISQPRVRGQVGGVWGSNTASPPTGGSVLTSSSGGGSFRNPNNSGHNDSSSGQHVYGSGSGGMSGVNTGRPLRVTSSSSGEYENRLLDGITAASGVRATPSKQELKEFVDKARSLDAVLVSQLLQKRFSAQAYQTQLKALCVLEALIQADFDDVVEYFRNENGELIDFETNSNKQLANKASQVLVLLGLKEAPRHEEAPTQSYSYQQPQQQQQHVEVKSPVQTTSNILDFDAPTVQSSAPSSAPQNGGFNFLEPEPAVAQTTTLFGQLNVKAGAQSSTPNTSSGFSELLGGSSSSPPLGSTPNTQKSDPLSFAFVSEVKPSNDPLAALLSSSSAKTQQSQVTNAFFPGQPAPVDPFFMSTQQPLGYSGITPTVQQYNNNPYLMQQQQQQMPFMQPQGSPFMQPGPMSFGQPQPFLRGAAPMAPNQGFGGLPPLGAGGPLDFQVQPMRSDKPPRRDIDIDPLNPVHMNRPNGGSGTGTGSDFSFINERPKDAFDFVQDHLKQQT